MVMNPYGMQLNNTVGAQESKIFNQMNKKKNEDELAAQSQNNAAAIYSNPNLDKNPPGVSNNQKSAMPPPYVPAYPSTPPPPTQQPATYNELSGYNEMAKRNSGQNLDDYARYNAARNNSLRIGQARQNVQQATNKQSIAETGLAADYTNKALNQGNQGYKSPSGLENFDTDFGKFTPKKLEDFNFPQRGNNLNDYNDILDRYFREGKSNQNGFNLPGRMPSEQTNLDRNLGNQRSSIEERIKLEEDRLKDLGKKYDDLLVEYEKRGKSFGEAQKQATQQLSKEYEDRVKGLEELQKFKGALESNTMSEPESVSKNLNDMLSGLDESDTVKALSALSGPGYNAGRLGLIDSILERESMGDAIRDAKSLSEEGKIAQSKKAGALSSYAKALDESRKSSDKKRSEMEQKIGELLEKKRGSLEENVKKKGEEIQKSITEGRKSLTDRKSQYSDLLDQISNPQRQSALAKEKEMRDSISKELDRRRVEEESKKRFEQQNPWAKQPTFKFPTLGQ